LKSGVAPCTIARVRRAFVTGGRWIAAKIAATSPQQTCHDHLPSFTPRRASAAVTWSGKRKMLWKRAQVTAAVALRGVKDGGDRGRSVADSSQQFWRRSIDHR